MLHLVLCAFEPISCHFLRLIDTFLKIQYALPSSLKYILPQGAEKIAEALKDNRSITNVDLVSEWNLLWSLKWRRNP